MQGLWSNCVRETFPVCKRSATLTDHYVKCQLALKLWLWQLSSKATLLRWITALWSFIYPRMSGQQRQQAVILWATTAVPDLRWNETSNRKTPISRLGAASWSCSRWRRCTIPPHLTGPCATLSNNGEKKKTSWGGWWLSVSKSIRDVPSWKVDSCWAGRTAGGGVRSVRMGRREWWGGSCWSRKGGRERGEEGTAEGIAHDKRQHRPGRRVLCL